MAPMTPVRPRELDDDDAAIFAYAHDAELAAANEAFWAERLALDAAIVERAIERGEIDAGTEPTQVIEAVPGPIHLRLLLTGRPVDRTFLERTVDTVVDGALRPPARR